ncbi:MAG: hypothetical protein AAFZ09_12505, partial [Pseudomonadota bacterium]
SSQAWGRGGTPRRGQGGAGGLRSPGGHEETPYLRLVLQEVGWRVLAPMQVVHAMVLWSDTAFIDESPVDAVEGTGRALVKPWVQTVIRTAYDPGLPDHADNPAHAGDLVAMI